MIACVQQAAAATPYVQSASAVALPAGGAQGFFGGLFGGGGTATVSCASGSCVAVGAYLDSNATPGIHPLVGAISHGTPATGTAVSLPANADSTKFDGLNGVSCFTASSCVAVGEYADASGNGYGLVTAINGGQPGAGVGLTLPADAATATPQSTLDGISCSSAGSCVGVGQYDTATNGQALVVPITGGVPGTGMKVTLPANADTSSNQYAELYDVDCWAAGSCVAVGAYSDASGAQQAMVVPVTNGVPGTAVEVAAPANANASGSTNASLNSVSCSATGACFAVGVYNDNSSSQGAQQAMSVAITAGVPGAASTVAPPSNATTSPSNFVAEVSAVSCPASGTCYASGSYEDTALNHQAMLVPLAAGSAPAGVEVTPPAAPSGQQNASLDGVSCLSAGSCVAVGTYRDATGISQGMTVAISGGSIATGAEEVPADVSTNSANAGAGLSSVACDVSGSCVAAGSYANTAGKLIPYVVNVQAPLAVTSSSLAAATVGSAYQQSLTASGAWGAYSWSVTSGTLPAGLSLNAATGAITGTPTSAGSSTFTVQASGTGAPVQTATQQLSIAVAAKAAVVTVHGGSLQVKGNHVQVKVSCAQSACRGTVKLEAGVVVAVKHGKKRVHKHETVVIGSSHYSVAAGHSANVAVALNGTGRGLLAKAGNHPLAVKIVTTTAQGKTASHGATIAKAAKKH